MKFMTNKRYAKTVAGYAQKTLEENMRTFLIHAGVIFAVFVALLFCWEMASGVWRSLIIGLNVGVFFAGANHLASMLWCIKLAEKHKEKKGIEDPEPRDPRTKESDEDEEH